MDIETGFVGEEVRVSSICREESLINQMIYVPRVRVTSESVGNTYSSIANLDIELIGNAPIANINVETFGDNIAASSQFDLQDSSQLPKISSMFLLARAKKEKDYSPQLYMAWTRTSNNVTTLVIAHRGGQYAANSEIDCTAFYN